MHDDLTKARHKGRLTPRRTGAEGPEEALQPLRMPSMPLSRLPDLNIYSSGRAS